MSKEELKQLILEVKNDIEEGMKEHNIPGFSIAIVERDGILWSEGFGYTDETKTKKVNPDTLFMIGSLSKAYNVVGFLRAMQKGKIHLDDLLREYYPEFSWKTRFGADEVDKIIFRHLLTHYAGLPHFTPMKSESNKYYSFDDYISKINDCWQLYPVGTRISYSNAGVDLVAYVLQQISGKSYPEYIKEEIYLPLNMKNSVVLPEDALKTNNHARGFVGEKQSTIEETKVPYLGAGAQWSSVNDMAKFLMMFFNKGKVKGEKYLEMDLLEEMYAIPFAEVYELSKIGLGIGINKGKYGGELELRFFGDGPGYFNLHHFFPNLGIGWLLQINQTYNVVPFLFKLAEKVSPALVKYKLGKIPEDLTVNDDIQLPPEVNLELDKLKRNEGRYISRMLDVEIKILDRQLFFTTQGKEQKLISHSDTEFSSSEYPLVKFTYDTSGKPTTIKLIQSVGRITVLDYDSGPMDEKGPNKEAWKEFNKLYKLEYCGIMLYSSTIVKNGHLKLATNINNKIYQLKEFEEGVFFTADGQNIIFKDDKLFLPSSTWVVDDITIMKIRDFLKNEPKHIQVTKSSLEELLFIYEATNQNENAEELKKIIKETYGSKEH